MDLITRQQWQLPGDRITPIGELHVAVLPREGGERRIDTIGQAGRGVDVDDHGLVGRPDQHTQLVESCAIDRAAGAEPDEHDRPQRACIDERRQQGWRVGELAGDDRVDPDAGERGLQLGAPCGMPSQAPIDSSA